MHVLNLVLKDLVQIARDRKSLFFLVLMPVAFTLLFGLAFHSSGETPRLPVGWVNDDRDGLLSEGLRELIEETGTIRLQERTASEVETQVGSERLAAAIVVPRGFSAQTLAGETVPLTVIAVPGLPAGQTATTALQVATNRLLAAVQAARVSANAVAALSPSVDDKAREAIVDVSLAQARAAWQEPPLVVALEAATRFQADQNTTPGGFVQSSPGMMVQFGVFSLIVSAMVLVVERKSRVLPRLLTAPVRRAEIIAGHLLAMFVIVLVQESMLILLGQFAFGVHYLREPLGTLLMAMALALWVSSLGLLIGAMAKGEEQVVILSLVAMFVFSALGGAWFPLEIAGQTFASVGRVLPTAWAMRGFQDIVVRGMGCAATICPAGLLLLYSALFFGLAVWRFRFE